MDTELRPLSETATLTESLDDREDKQTNVRAHSIAPSFDQKPVARSRRRWLSFEWIWECVAIFLVFAALAAMFGILVTAQGESVAAWRLQHYNVSINAVVAILTALLKGGCMFVMAEVIGQTKWMWFEKTHRLRDFKRIDNASRGPWGSVQLLGAMNGPKLALVGAFITIVALAVDPFTQNIIATQSCSTPASTLNSPNMTVTVPTANWYQDVSTYSLQRQNYTDGDFEVFGIDRFSPGIGIKSAVYSSLYGSVTSVTSPSSIHIPCPGVNCTFGTYTTIGVCHRCADISKLVNKTCQANPPPSTNGNAFQPACSWSLPNGQKLYSHPGSEAFYTSLDFDTVWAVVNSTSAALTLPNTPGTFANLSILANVTTVPCSPGNILTCTTPVGAAAVDFQTLAIECSLFPCARTYTASVIAGTVVETEINRTVAQGTWLSDQGAFREALIPDTISIDVPNCTLKSHFPTDNCTYKFDATEVMALGNFFWSFWNGTMSGRNFLQASADNNIVEVLYNEAAANFAYIDGILGGVADSMTSAIRTTKNNDALAMYETVQGEVYVADSCIEVRWAWIILPGIVTLLTLLILSRMIMLGMTFPDRPAWKSSALPVLFHGLNVGEIPPKEKLANLGEMEREASRLWVRLSNERSDNLCLETSR